MMKFKRNYILGFIVFSILFFCNKNINDNNIVIDLRGNRVVINEEPIRKEKISSNLKAKVDKLDSLELNKMQVQILVSNKTTTGNVIEIKKVLKNLGVFKIEYISEGIK